MLLYKFWSILLYTCSQVDQGQSCVSFKLKFRGITLVHGNKAKLKLPSLA